MLHIKFCCPSFVWFYNWFLSRGSEGGFTVTVYWCFELLILKDPKVNCSQVCLRAHWNPSCPYQNPMDFPNPKKNKLTFLVDFDQLQTAVTFWLLNRFQSSWYLGCLARAETLENGIDNRSFCVLPTIPSVKRFWPKIRSNTLLSLGIRWGSQIKGNDTSLEWFWPIPHSLGEVTNHSSESI